MERKAQAKKIAARFRDEDAAREYLERLRWPDGPICPKCGTASKPYALKGKTGYYRCSDKDCRSDFTVRVGTVFESSHIPLHQWLFAVHLLCSSKKGMSSHQVHRTMGVTYKTAWFMTHRIREAMREGHGLIRPLGGPGKVVEIDETYYGRNPLRKKGIGGYGHMLPVVSLVERGGKSRSFYVENVNRKTVEKIVRENVDRESEAMTDKHTIYRNLDQIVAQHDAVDHRFEYGRWEKGRLISTNSIEGFFSIFKRGMKGIYQHCGEQHLHRYLAEFDFRYGLRQIDDVQRTDEALRGIVGKRLTYRRTRQQPQA